jgi:DNA-binding transcriptional regulator GbsR (MarR family)
LGGVHPWLSFAPHWLVLTSTYRLILHSLYSVLPEHSEYDTIYLPDSEQWEGARAMRYFEEKHFVEDISLYFEQMGLPRTAGRVLGVLLISDPPAQSLTDLCALLKASKSSVSTTTRLLVEMDLIERVPSPVPRQVYFQFRPGGWTVFVRQRLRLWALLHQIAEHGLELLQDGDPALRDRLQEAHDMFSLIEEELPALLERVETRRKR